MRSGAAWNLRVMPDVPVKFCVDAAAIRRVRIFVHTRTGFDFTASKRVSPFARMHLPSVSPVDHTQSSYTQGSAIRINGAVHIKGMPEIESFFVAVPFPERIGIGEMAFTGTMADAIFLVFVDLTSIRVCVRMDAGAIAGKCEMVCRDEASFREGRVAAKRKTCWSLCS